MTVLWLVAMALSVAGSTRAQAPTQDRVLGEVTAIGSPGRRLTLKTATSQSVTILLDEQTICRRVPPGATTLDTAVEIKFEDIIVGDRVLARGSITGAKDTMLARSLVVMSKTEITQKRERDRARWQSQGIMGRVTALNPETKEITLFTTSRNGGQKIIVAGSGNVQFSRYAPDSVRFSDARQSSFSELRVGDQLRAVGERSADGTRFTPTEIVAGSFRTIGGIITAIDAASGEIKVEDIQTRQPITIVITQDSMLRRLSPEVIKLLEYNSSGGTPQRDAGEPSAAGASTLNGRRSQGSDESLEDLIEKEPRLALRDLTIGEAVLVSSTMGAQPSRVTAIMLATGVSDFLKRQQKREANTHDLNLGLGLPAGVAP